MQSIPKELLREYIEAENFQTTGDVLNGLKSLFKQVLEEAMAVEMDEFMGREKHARQGETEERIIATVSARRPCAPSWARSN